MVKRILHTYKLFVFSTAIAARSMQRTCYIGK